ALAVLAAPASTAELRGITQLTEELALAIHADQIVVAHVAGDQWQEPARADPADVVDEDEAVAVRDSATSPTDEVRARARWCARRRNRVGPVNIGQHTVIVRRLCHLDPEGHARRESGGPPQHVLDLVGRQRISDIGAANGNEEEERPQRDAE